MPLTYIFLHISQKDNYVSQYTMLKAKAKKTRKMGTLNKT